MRILYVLPLAALFGCAHENTAESVQPIAQAEPSSQSTATNEIQPSASAQEQQQQAQAQPSAQASTSSQMAQQEQAKSKAEPIAGAEKESNPATCGLVRVRFETDSAELDDQDKALLISTAECLKQNKQLKVNVEGNADERGSQEHNMKLGGDRAQAVSSFLQNQGVAPDQLKLVSYGEDNPLCLQSDADCWAKNRRTAVRPTCHM